MNTPKPFALFDNAQTNTQARLYADPVRVISCSTPENVTETLTDLDQALGDGFHVAGYLAYELGYLFEDKLAPLRPATPDQPLIWMGVFKEPEMLDPSDVSELMKNWAKAPHSTTPPKAEISRDHYLTTVATIQNHIQAGDVYQINYTFKQHFDFTGCAKSLYARLRTRQRAAYGAFVQTPEHRILSLSPELFVRTEGSTIHTRPMKGTAPRAASPAADQAVCDWLREDEKSRAENLMIVDLLRNDLSRISEVGSVHVTDLFNVETYPTLHQMTSGITSTLKPETSFSSLIKALFPCGSITGAPKVKAMECIQALEISPRGVYTGAVGYGSAKDGLRFNVAIRTLTLDGDGNGEMGIGSGIVYDSNAADEWDECHLKANFLTQPDQPPFEILETLKWDPDGGFVLLDRHLDRLKSSAASFGYPFDLGTIQAALTAAVSGSKPLRVRLTLSTEGQSNVEIQALNELTELSFSISNTCPDAQSPFTYHKTTQRDFYEAQRAAQTGDEVVFTNAQGHLTEGSFTNLFVDIQGKLFTPPVSAGLLPGTLRQELLDRGEAFEADLTAVDLNAPNQVFLGNSVRGLVPAHFL